MSSVRAALLDLLARLTGVPTGAIEASCPLRDLLARTPLPRSAADTGTPGDEQEAELAEAVPEEIRLFLLAAAVEDAFGVDLTERDEFESLWSGTVGRFLEVVEAACA